MCVWCVGFFYLLICWFFVGFSCNVTSCFSKCTQILKCFREIKCVCEDGPITAQNILQKKLLIQFQQTGLIAELLCFIDPCGFYRFLFQTSLFVLCCCSLKYLRQSVSLIKQDTTKFRVVTTEML